MLSDELNIDCGDILLRPYRTEDLEAFHAITHEPEIVRYLPGWNATKEMRADWLINYEIPGNEQFLQTAQDGGEIGELRLRLAIVLKETGAFIGWVCTGPKDELPPPNREIMFGISSSCSGRGYTTQAAAGLIRYLFERTQVEELNAIALTCNVSSNRVIAKCGFRLLGDITIEGEAYHLTSCSERIGRRVNDGGGR